MRSIRLIVVLSLTLFAVATVNAAPICKAPRVMVLFDRSSSMVESIGFLQTKWSVAKSALNTVLKSYETTIHFGAMPFPAKDQCSPGVVKVTIGAGNASAIMAALGPKPPTGGNGTPMAQTLDAAAKVQGLLDAGYSNHVLLITDGQQYCLPYDPATRLLPVNAVGNLATLGIKTHVVGFGDKVDALVLNKMAVIGGTRRTPGCDASGTKPNAAQNCYHHAGSLKELLAALQAIAKSITQEICDGLDNDCNGQIDDALTAPPCAEQDGVCKGALRRCGGGAGWLACTDGDLQLAAQGVGSIYQADETLCDGKDNDCDGTVDEGCACTDGATRPCGSDTGVCVQGTQTCTAGSWLACQGGVSAVPEACDGLDNDCDGTVDEGLTRACTSICGGGQQLCLAGAYTACDAQQPTQEICDGQDNDCDGEVDGEGAHCDGDGVCSGGVCLEPQQGELPPYVGAAASAGCDCNVGEKPSAGRLVPLALVLILAALIMLFTRRSSGRNR